MGTGVGSVFTVILLVIGYLLKRILTAEKEKTEAILTRNAELTSEFTQLKEKNAEEHAKIWEVTQQMRVELTMHIRANESIHSSLLNLQGVVKSQSDTLYMHIEKITTANAKLEALFRFVDAAKRPTD